VVRFGLLGDLRIVDDAGSERTVPAAKQRILLAALLLDANRTVSRDALIDALWDSTPPPNAGAALRTYLARLRHALGDTQGRIIAKPSGFLLELREATELDVTEVEHYSGTAAAAARDSRWDRASQALRAAEGLWRGTPPAERERIARGLCCPGPHEFPPEF
jgi:DNA-binding SARP family transcriptional activator